MNSKDYKEIARIIGKNRIGKNRFVYYENSGCWLKIREALDFQTKDLADYFEREDKDNDFGVEIKKGNFNKKQFLKECGVNGWYKWVNSAI